MKALIGITGGIGSGKSTIARELQSMGYPVYYTDAEAMQLIETDESIKRAIVQEFGADSYTERGYNKAYIASLIFSSPERLKQLNAIVHPAVRRHLQTWYHQQSQTAENLYAFAESAILFESSLDSICNGVVHVSAPLETRIERTMKRDHLSREQVEARIRNQMSDAERTHRSTLTICNDGHTPIPTLTTYLLTTLQQHFSAPKTSQTPTLSI